MSPKKCMNSVSSTEFVQLVHLMNEERTELTPLHYQVAVVAQQVFRVGAMFASGSKRVPPLKDFLIQFDADNRQSDEGDRDKLINPHGRIDVKDFAGGGGLRGIEVGQPLNEHWQRVNDHAKMSWAALLAHLPIEPDTPEVVNG